MSKFQIGAVVRAADGRIGVVTDCWPLCGYPASGVHPDECGGVVTWEPLLSGATSQVVFAEVVVVPLARESVPA